MWLACPCPPLSTGKAYETWKSSYSSWMAVRFPLTGAIPGSDKWKSNLIFSDPYYYCYYYYILSLSWSQLSGLPSASAETYSSPRYQRFDEFEDERSPRKWTEIYKGCYCPSIKTERVAKTGKTDNLWLVFATLHYTDQLKLGPANKELLYQKLHG